MGDVAVHEGACTVEAVVNEHEATRLLAVAPNFDFVMAGQFRGDNFSADRCWGLLAAAIEGAVGTINIMVAGHPCFETEVFAEVPAHPFAKELFPAIAVHWIGRIGVRFLKPGISERCCLKPA